MPAIKKVPLLMLAGSIGWLKSTAISRLVAMPPLSGTTIDTVGPPEADTVVLPTPPHLRKNITNRRRVETLESCLIDIRFLSNYQGGHGGIPLGSKPRLSGHAKQA